MTNTMNLQDLDSKLHLGAQTKKCTLPTNSIFDKGKVGCGGTTLAIESDIPYIICVPFVSLIENKVEQYKDGKNERYKGEIYGFHGDNNLKKNLKAYLDRVEVPKIMVTYDSLEKLSNWIDTSKYNILIDELHLLFTEYSYRNNAAQSVLRNYTRYKEFCFMTATPLEEEFMLEELKDLPIVRATWDNTKEVEIQSIRCMGKVKYSVAQLVNQFINDGYTENAYFFVNSVKYIQDLIQICNLNETNTRVIYSKNNKTEVGIPNGSALDTPKKINFITSTAFEGTDFYDENGITFIISDSAETHTLIDISTKFQQIAGRIRNSKYSHKIYHIFKETRYSHLSYEEFKELTNKTIEETKRFINNNSGESYASKINANDLYVQKEGNTFTFDPNKIKIDLYNFKICRNIYSLRVNLNTEYEKYNFIIKEYDHIATNLVIDNVMTQSFEEVVDAVKEESLNLFNLTTPIKDAAFKKYPFLNEAIEKLGFDGIESLNYNITNIKAKLIRTLDKDVENKVIMALKNRINISNGDFISVKTINNVLSKVYKDLGITKVAKSTDILNYYECKDNKCIAKKINNIKTDGYLIIRSKTIFN